MPRKLFTSLLCPSMKVTEDQLETDVNLLNIERSIFAMNRRKFVGALAATGATAATIGSGFFVTQAEAQATPTTVVDILNFALNLEFLEANLYIAVSGAPALSAAVINGGYTPTNLPTGITLDAQTKATAAGLAADETNHIAALIATITSLGGTPIAQPQIDYSAGGTVKITTQAQFLAVARQFTAVGNSAYAGAAQFLYDTPTVLAAAARILGAEGQHLGAVNYLCALQGVVSPAVDTLDVPPTSSPISYFTVTPSTIAYTPAQPPVPAPVAPATTSPTPTLLAPTGPSLGIFRTFTDVLGIVYGQTLPTDNAPPKTGVTAGGFFPGTKKSPTGFNGAITST